MVTASSPPTPEHLLARVIQDFMQFMHETGLSRPQIHALLHIYHAGECPVSEIAALTDSSPAAASQLVDRLVRQGLVERTEDPHNRRMKKLHLTAKSVELFQRGISSNHFLLELMAELTPTQRKTVHTALGYLMQASQHIHSSSTRKVKSHASNV